ncbi:MAG: TetR/AcrR family transcriptional regulator [Oceanococcus sp.]
MSAELDPSAIAKVPTQVRAKERFESVLAEAEKMLVADGIFKFSIPTLAERLGMTRGSVYAYFPTHYAILNELVRRYLDELEGIFLEQSIELGKMPWKTGVDVVVQQSVTFHNEHPAARLLILGGAVTDSAYRAQDSLLRRLGGLGRAVWESQSGRVLPKSPDIFTLAVDMAVSCYRRSVFEHGEITPAYTALASRAMIQFLTPFLDDPQARVPTDEQ